MTQKNTIQCPSCKAEIDVNDILYHQIEEQLQQKIHAEAAELKQENETILSEIKDKESALRKEQQNFDQKLSDSVAKQLKAEKKVLSDQLKKQITEEQSDQLTALQDQITEKTEQVKELNQTKIQVEQLKREKNEAEEKAQFKAEQSLTEQLKVEREKIQKFADEQNELKLRQKDEHLDQLKRQLSDAQRKAEQGSMQTQGEVQELAIEEWLIDKFPLDTIDEIKKGQRGGDCLQTVNTYESQNCGTIYYESKRTKDFQKTWIEKFKADMREKAVDIGVLVTNVLPKEFDRMGLMDGVWVCTYEEFKALSFILREKIIALNMTKKSGENQVDKMGMLYSYLISNEFKMQIEAIVEGFTQMQTDLDSEKRALARIWKQREKQITKVLENTTGMYGSIRGIAGNAIGHIKSLELPYSDEPDAEEKEQ
ncbi:MAG: Caldesmon [Cycloclasticus sp. symbiont of Poecilosclerida sp. N]|nr:MAG: Caldesmon [Cycloclasticus sp. symbiont of Poecilosclerida sp. N]